MGCRVYDSRSSHLAACHSGWVLAAQLGQKLGSAVIAVIADLVRDVHGCQKKERKKKKKCAGRSVKPLRGGDNQRPYTQRAKSEADGSC